MHQPDDPYSPAERATRRRVLSSPPPGEPGSEPTAQEGTERIEQMMESYKAAIQQQLEEGLSAIRNTAGKLMHEVANEVWKTTEGDKLEALQAYVRTVRFGIPAGGAMVRVIAGNVNGTSGPISGIAAEPMNGPVGGKKHLLCYLRGLIVVSQ